MMIDDVEESSSAWVVALPTCVLRSGHSDRVWPPGLRPSNASTWTALLGDIKFVLDLHEVVLLRHILSGKSFAGLGDEADCLRTQMADAIHAHILRTQERKGRRRSRPRNEPPTPPFIVLSAVLEISNLRVLDAVCDVVAKMTKNENFRVIDIKKSFFLALDQVSMVSLRQMLLGRSTELDRFRDNLVYDLIEFENELASQ